MNRKSIIVLLLVIGYWLIVLVLALPANAQSVFSEAPTPPETPASAPTVISPPTTPTQIIPTAPKEFKIVPRPEWLGPTKELDSATQEELWPNEYIEVEKFVLHDSGAALRDVDGDGLINQTDYLKLVQGIYNWHARALGWGDIGYQFVIDPDGNIYEGKIGGDGIVGGHTLKSKACHKSSPGQAVGYNRGSIGISIIGEYDRDSLTSAAQESLINLIALKAREFEIEPLGQSLFVDQEMPNLVMHKEIDCASDLGNNFSVHWDNIKNLVQQKYNQLMKEIKRKATLVAQSDKVLNLRNGEEREVWVDFKNDGNTAWHNYTKQAVFLGQEVIKNKLASLDSLNAAAFSTSAAQIAQAHSIFSDPDIKTVQPSQPSQSASQTNNNQAAEDDKEGTITKKPALSEVEGLPQPPEQFYTLLENRGLAREVVIATAKEPNIKPGETGRFAFKIKKPNPTAETKKYILTLGTRGWFPEAEIALTVNNIELEYGGLVESFNIPVAILADTQNSITIKYKNTGTKIWKRGEIILNTADPTQANGLSGLYDKKWPGRAGGFSFAETEIKPGELATFSFKIVSSLPGFYRQDFYLVRNIFQSDHPEIILGSEKIAGSDFERIIRVDSPWRAELVEHNIPSALKPSQRVSVELKFKNAGMKTWSSRGQTVLNVYNQDKKPSAFYDRYDWLSKETAAWLIEKQVKPGEIGTFKLYLKAPREFGEYNQLFILKSGKQTIYIENKEGVKIATRVRGK